MKTSVVALTFFVLAPGPLVGQVSDSGLSLDAVLTEARERNPMLQALSASARAAGYRVSEASTLPDPQFQVGIMNFGVPDLNTDMAMSMAPAVQLMQMVPFPGKLSLQGDVARAEQDIAEARAEEGWWDVRLVASELFYELYELDRRLEVMVETLSLLEDFQQVARAMYATGTGRQTDVLRADVEVARMDGEIRRMRAERVAMAARLNALLDRPAGDPLPSPVLPELPLDVPQAAELGAWAEEGRPLLTGARLGVERARSRSSLMAKQIWPDLSIGAAYGQRNRGGTERMASVMLGFTLPIHAGSRQRAWRDEASAMERMAEAELSGSRAEVDAQVAEHLAELDRARMLVELYRDEVVPEARAAVESAFSSYRVGSVDFMTLVDAQMTVNRYEGELYTLLADYGRAVAGLESAVGRRLPSEGPTLSEDR